jgi:hypothetical protein
MLRGPTFNEVHYRELLTDGGWVGAGPTVLRVPPNHAGEPTVVALSDRYLLAWEDRNGGFQVDVWGSVVGFDGGVIAAPFPLSADADGETDPELLTAGDVALLAWGIEGSSPRVVLAQFDGDGGTQSVPLSFADAEWPALSWHDGQVVLAFERNADGGTYVEAHRFSWPLAEAPTALFVASAAPDARPKLARVDARRAILAYAADAPDGGGRRLYATMLGLAALGDSCAESSECGAQATCSGNVCVGTDPRDLVVVCGCASGSFSLFAAGLGLIGLGVAARRRRRSGRRVS